MAKVNKAKSIVKASDEASPVVLKELTTWTNDKKDLMDEKADIEDNIIRLREIEERMYDYGFEISSLYEYEFEISSLEDEASKIQEWFKKRSPNVILETFGELINIRWLPYEFHPWRSILLRVIESAIYLASGGAQYTPRKGEMAVRFARCSFPFEKYPALSNIRDKYISMIEQGERSETCFWSRPR